MKRRLSSFWRIVPNSHRASDQAADPSPARTGSPLLKRLAAREGGALLEMAFTAPVFMMLLMGIFSVSVALYQKLALAEAVSVGARFIALDRGDTDPCTAATAKITSVASGLSSSKMSFTYTLNGVATSGTACAGSGSAPNANMVSGASATVRVTYPCALIAFPAFGNRFSTTCNLSTSITEVIQ